MILLYIIGSCFLVSLIVYFKNLEGHQYLKLFPPFLFIILTSESIGLYQSHHGRNNTQFYNGLTIFEFLFFLFIIRSIISSKRVKKIITFTIPAYLIAAVINILYIQVNLFHTLTYSLGCLLIVIFCVYFFFELFKHAKFVSLKNNPAFWICSGLLFYYSCTLPLFGLVNVWKTISPVLLSNFTIITTILNGFLYSLFTIAFLCRNRFRKYTLSLS